MESRQIRERGCSVLVSEIAPVNLVDCRVVRFTVQRLMRSSVLVSDNMKVMQPLGASPIGRGLCELDPLLSTPPELFGGPGY